jgi:hypothetical protein
MSITHPIIVQVERRLIRFLTRKEGIRRKCLLTRRVAKTVGSRGVLFVTDFRFALAGVHSGDSPKPDLPKGTS